MVPLSHTFVDYNIKSVPYITGVQVSLLCHDRNYD